MKVLHAGRLCEERCIAIWIWHVDTDMSYIYLWKTDNGWSSALENNKHSSQRKQNKTKFYLERHSFCQFRQKTFYHFVAFISQLIQRGYFVLISSWIDCTYWRTSWFILFPPVYNPANTLTCNSSRNIFFPICVNSPRTQYHYYQHIIRVGCNYNLCSRNNVVQLLRIKS